ncbi:hypothetical protein [Clostridioides difficile]|uniref:Uncharacterized protein n=1 Tax=Clostridioides difficile TaxID=1496 RepID=A0A2R4NC62_CLODI|nr:hypothetical protein [Clostridioides difficile]AVX33704.1 hypothetical protein plasmid_LIBA6289_00018 [Clostridioides difficile]MCW0666492.1 hypothetical protein [Clostridioides difficile]MDI6342385.1 hypothetical protein [Clostridioides difficile]MDL0308366.1 hypothetical protein [Clostridioides difficile]MDS6284906.1 hypothetical protein [Clostridioides difficile]
MMRLNEKKIMIQLDFLEKKYGTEYLDFLKDYIEFIKKCYNKVS